MCEKKPYFPMFIDISKKKIIVIGGGKIAERRVKTLLKFAKDITLISPEVTEEIKEMIKNREIRWIQAAFDDSIRTLLQGADMVLAATDDRQCNEKAAKICKAQGIPVNVSHKKEMCDFYFPAVVVQDNVVAGITSSGRNHSQARQVRERVEEALTNE